MDDTRQEAFFRCCNHKGHDLEKVDADDLISPFDDEEDFAYQIIEECYKLPKFARDLFCSDY